MFVQLHVVVTLPTHVPNRGADGLAKRAVYAGIERQRISYQAQQYALRHAPEFAAVEAASGAGATTRTALVGERLLIPALTDAEVAAPQEWSNAVMALWRKEEKGDAKDDDAKAAPLIVGEQEIRLITAVVKACVGNGVESKDLRKLVEKRPPKDTPDAVITAIDAFKTARGACGADCGLFGRMVTGVAVSTVERCVRFSDALTTHGITPASDFFLTTDDLKDRDEGEAGGSHIGNREMTAGTFYRHILLDTDQMERNGLSLNIVEPLMEALLRVSPIGSRSPARIVDAMAEMGGQVRSLMDAFADPVSKPDAAVQRLCDFAKEDYATYGEPQAVLWLSEQPPVKVSSLARAVATGCADSPSEAA